MGKIKLTVNNFNNFVEKNKLLANYFLTLKGAEFSCLQGKCGKCLVEVLNGDLNKLTTKERVFLDFMNIENTGRYRLLCQLKLQTDTQVRKY